MKDKEKNQRVERHIVSGKQYDEICFLSKNLYNRTNYCIRQSFINTGKLPSEYELSKKLCIRENNVDYKALPAQTAQQVIKLLYKNWKSFFKAIKEYKKHPEKFKGRPKLPKYKNKTKGRNVVVFPFQNLSYKDGFIRFPKQTGLKPIKTNISKKQIAQVRIIPQATCFIIEVVYNVILPQKDSFNENVLGIDLGVNNFATCINNVGKKPFIVNGRIIKSINQHWNKTVAKLRSQLENNRYTSYKIHRITLKRNNQITDYMHKASKFIIDYCLKNSIDNIIIGHNNYWKQESNIGKKNNQTFVEIPFSKFISMLKYKCEDAGIQFFETEESYTSKIDHFAYETMEHHDVYLGKRIKRGLFQSSTGRMLNADMNGAIGIIRKVLGDTVIKQLTNKGRVLSPIRIFNFNKKGLINFNRIY